VTLRPNDCRVPRLWEQTFDERREDRHEVLRVAEIHAEPARRGESGLHTGFAFDESDSGMCVAVDAPLATGGTVRVVLRDFEGEVLRDSEARVAWCRPSECGRFAVGLDAGEPRSRDARESRRVLQLPRLEAFPAGSDGFAAPGL